MTANSPQPRTAFYLLLLAIQITGSILLVWNELPVFRQILLNPGMRPSNEAHYELVTFAIVTGMQISYWYRLRYVPMPLQRPNVFVNHVFLFLGRLSFIFGSAFFAVIVFRHLPEISFDIEIPLMTRRGAIFAGSLFALFCASIEMERFGQSFAARD